MRMDIASITVMVATNHHLWVVDLIHLVEFGCYGAIGVMLCSVLVDHFD